MVQILYNSEFIEALDILRWTFIGDYLRVSAWFLTVFMLARADMAMYLLHEFITSVL